MLLIYLPLGLRRFPINGNAQTSALRHVHTLSPRRHVRQSVGHLIGMASVHFFKHCDLMFLFYPFFHRQPPFVSICLHLRPSVGLFVVIYGVVAVVHIVAVLAE